MDKRTAKAESPARIGVQRAYEEVREMAIKFELPPGQNIKEAELAKRLGLSRTPVREALNRLVIEGLLSFIPNKGFINRSLEVKETLDLYEMRLALECAAMRWACRRAADADLADLRDYWEGIGRRYKKMSTDEIAQADEEFHRRIAGMSGNKEIVAALNGIAARIRFCRMIDLEDRDRRGPLYDEHEDILVALEARNPTQGIKALTAHIEMSSERVIDIVKEGLARIYIR